jgi:hypothetical protein
MVLRIISGPLCYFCICQYCEDDHRCLFNGAIVTLLCYGHIRLLYCLWCFKNFYCHSYNMWGYMKTNYVVLGVNNALIILW